MTSGAHRLTSISKATVLLRIGFSVLTDPVSTW